MGNPLEETMFVGNGVADSVHLCQCPPEFYIPPQPPKQKSQFVVSMELFSKLADLKINNLFSFQKNQLN